MTHIHADGKAIRVVGDRKQILCTPRLLTLAGLDGNVDMTVGHESVEADLNIASVWATDLGDCYVEVMYPGDGPEGGELVLVVPAENTIIIGDLMADGAATEGWANALDLVLGLTNKETLVHTSAGVVARDELDQAHQRLLGQLLG